VSGKKRHDVIEILGEGPLRIFKISAMGLQFVIYKKTETLCFRENG
jgi:hypothetical protein